VCEWQEFALAWLTEGQSHASIFSLKFKVKQLTTQVLAELFSHSWSLEVAATSRLVSRGQTLFRTEGKGLGLGH